MENSTTATLEPQTELELELEQPLIGELPEDRSLAAQLAIDIFKSVVATIFIFTLLVTYVVQGFKVYGKCMEPNLVTGERLLGNKFIYRFKEPERGDVVIFRYPRDPSKIYIKRVVAKAGETVAIRGGRLFVNGKPVNEKYIQKIPHGDYGPEVVQAENLFVLGDNRDYSNDSRHWGQLPLEEVQAKVWLRYWPVKRLEVLK